MLQVSKEFQTAMVADTRRVFGRVLVDYTDPLFDQSITVTANEQANAAALLPQVADNLTDVPRRWASADGTTLADGLSFPAPSVPTDGQMGWWGVQMAGVDGAFSTPFPVLTVSFASRPVHSLLVVGDSVRGEFPVDFEIRLLGAGGVVRHARTVTGNALMVWQEIITPVTEVLQYVLEVRRWSHAGRQAKVVEVFTSIQETYEGDNLISIGLLEEREVAQQSLPVGNVSANEITVRLDNSTRRFDAGNRESPLYQLLMPNRRIRAWLGLKGDGQGVNMQQSVDFNAGVRRNLVVNAGRLELPTVGAAAFIRNSTAHLPDGTLVNANLPRFVPGRFGQAKMAEEGTTNLLTEAQSSVEVDSNADGLSDGWSVWTADTLRTHLFSRPAALHHGAFSQRVEIISTSTGVDTTLLIFNIPITAGLPYTMTAYILSNTGKVYMHYRYRTSAGGFISDSPISFAPVNQLTRVTLTHTAPANATQMHIYVRGITRAGEWMQFDSVQLEQKAYATTWQLGGTPRVGELLTIPSAGIFNRGNWSVEEVYTPQIPMNVGGVEKTLFAYEIDANNWVRLRVGINGEWNFAIVSGGVQYTIISANNAVVQGTAYQWQISGNGSVMRLCVNGVQIGADTAYVEPVGTLPANLFIGSRPDGTLHANGFIDDLRISSRARTLAEHQAAFNSGQPLPVDVDTTYMLRADGNLNHGQGGDYTSPEYDLSTVGTVAASGISWHVPADGVTRDVSARLDGQAWTPVANGGMLPFTPGQLLTGRRLQLHALLRRG